MLLLKVTFSVGSMGLLSSIVMLLVLLVVTEHYKNITDEETETSLSTQSKLIDIQEVGRGPFKKRAVPTPKRKPLCGRAKINLRPINHGVDSVNNDDNYSYDDIDYDQHLEKIFGGRYVIYGEIPWQAGIRYYHRYICSAVIISEFWVATAAHCMETFQMHLEFVKVIVGDHVLPIDDAFEATYDIQSMYTPKEYSVDTLDWDIALIKIKPTSDGRGILFNEYVQPVCLPQSEDSPYQDQPLEVSGWGKTTYGSPFSQILKKANMVARIPSNCQGWVRMEFTDRMLCAASRINGVCPGDMGGPATTKHKGFVVLTGLVITGPKCGQIFGSSVHVNVYNVRNWINTTIGSNSNGLEAVMPVRPFQSG